MATRALILLFSMLLLAVSAAAGASEIGGTLTADEIIADGEAGFIYAAGNVELERNGMKLRTESLYYDRIRGLMYATGPITYYDGYLARGEYLKYDVAKKTGYLNEGELSVVSDDTTKQRFFQGRGITLLDKGSFLIEEGCISSCPGDEKPWYLSAEQIRVKAGEYLTSRNTALYAGGIPVLYTPWFLAPVKTDRESGFLMPGFGFSGRSGAILNLPYYHVLDESRDATYTLRLKTKTSAGLDTQYRYMNSRTESGEAGLTLVDNYDLGKEYLFARWRHARDGDHTVRANVGYLNRKDYFREYDETSELKTLPYYRSQAYIEKDGGRRILSGGLFFSRNIAVSGNELHKIDVRHEGLLIPAGPVFYGYNGSGSALMKGDGDPYGRAIVEPFVTARYDAGEYGMYTEGRVRLGLYSRGVTEDETPHKENVRLTAGAFLNKAVLVNDRYRVVNTFRAEAILPRNLNGDEVLRTDSLDFYDQVGRLRYAYEEKWYRPGDLTSVGYLSLEQEYLLSERDGRRPFSDIVATGRLTSSPFSIDMTGRYDHDQGSFREASVTGAVNAKPVRFSLSYFFRKDSDEYINLDLYGKMGYNFAIILGSRYDIAGDIAREVKTGIEYAAGCYSVQASFLRRDVPREDIVLFTVNLYGLGEIKQNF